MKIAHISDLHLCASHLPDNLKKTRQLIETALRQGAEHLVITGDITHNADFDDFISMRHLLAEFNLLDSRKATVVIGNHDIFGGVHFAEDILTFPQKCMEVDYEQKIRDFKLCFYELFEDAFFPFPNQVFPFGKVVNNVLLVGLNSTRGYSLIKNPFASRGKIGKMQRKGLVDILRRPEFQNTVKIILLHHHCNKPPASSKNYLVDIERFGGKLTKKHKLLKLIRRYNVALTLHGHQHRSLEYTQNGARFLNAGASTMGYLNLITIHPHAVETEIIPVQVKIPPRNGATPPKIALAIAQTSF